MVLCSMKCAARGVHVERKCCSWRRKFTRSWVNRLEVDTSCKIWQQQSLGFSVNIKKGRTRLLLFVMEPDVSHNNPVALHCLVHFQSFSQTAGEDDSNSFFPAVAFVQMKPDENSHGVVHEWNHKALTSKRESLIKSIQKRDHQKLYFPKRKCFTHRQNLQKSLKSTLSKVLDQATGRLFPRDSRAVPENLY